MGGDTTRCLRPTFKGIPWLSSITGILGQLHADSHGAIIQQLTAQVAAVVGMVGVPGGLALLGIPQLLALAFYLGY